MRKEELLKQLTDMVRDTKLGKIHWEVKYQTTEYNDLKDKPTEESDGEVWTVDECFVSYYCEYKGKEFLMITYEMIHSAFRKQKTTNLIFLPLLGIRYFDVHVLLPYAVEASQMLIYQVHALWEILLEKYKKNPESVSFDVSPRVLTIKDENK
ncbi:MAG: hypothetical protein IKJ01_01350 [Lachnospiraceae bacterium]|nr:hypothetical protein [Lachnospiraceae bacterium]